MKCPECGNTEFTFLLFSIKCDACGHQGDPFYWVTEEELLCSRCGSPDITFNNDEERLCDKCITCKELLAAWKKLKAEYDELEEKYFELRYNN